MIKRTEQMSTRRSLTRHKENYSTHTKKNNVRSIKIETQSKIDNLE